jgi:hypothetical protein
MDDVKANAEILSEKAKLNVKKKWTCTLTAAGQPEAFHGQRPEMYSRVFSAVTFK